MRKSLRSSTGLTAVALALALGASPARAADKWRPQAEIQLKPGSARNLGRLEVMAPIRQTDTDMLFLDLRGQLDDLDSAEGNWGIGYRHLMPEEGWIVGGYGFYDRRVSANHNGFNQLTFGVEALAEDWEARANSYIGLTGAQGTGPATGGAITGASVIGGTVTIQRAGVQSLEKSLNGVDLELGYRVAENILTVNDSLRLFGGGYHFFGSGAPDVSGPRGRLELGFDDLFGTEGMKLTLGAEAQYDGVRHDEYYGEVRLTVPLTGWFGGGEAEPRPALSGLERRMTTRVRRDPDIIIGTRSQGVTLNEPAFTPTTGGQITGAFFADDQGNPGGAGTVEDPIPFAEAATRAGVNGVIIASSPDNATDVTGFALNDGQLLTTGSVTLNVFAGDGTAVPITFAGFDTAINNVGGADATAVTLADFNIIDGLAFTGAGTAIGGAGIMAPIIRHVSVDGVRNGIAINGTDFLTVRDFTATDSAFGIAMTGMGGDFRDIAITGPDDGSGSGIFITGANGAVNVEDIALNDLLLGLSFNAVGGTVTGDRLTGSVNRGGLTIANSTGSFQFGQVGIGVAGSTDPAAAGLSVIAGAPDVTIDQLDLAGSDAGILLGQFDPGASITVNSGQVDGNAGFALATALTAAGDFDFSGVDFSSVGGLGVLISNGPGSFKVGNVAVSDITALPVGVTIAGGGQVQTGDITISNVAGNGLQLIAADGSAQLGQVSVTDVTGIAATLGSMLGGYSVSLDKLVVAGGSLAGLVSQGLDMLTIGAGSSVDVEGGTVMSLQDIAILDASFDHLTGSGGPGILVGGVSGGLQVGDVTLEDVEDTGISLAGNQDLVATFGDVRIGPATMPTALAGQTDVGVLIAFNEGGSVSFDSLAVAGTADDGLQLALNIGTDFTVIGATGVEDAGGDGVEISGNSGGVFSLASLSTGGTTGNGLFVAGNTDIGFTVSGATDISDTGMDGDGVGLQDNIGGSFTFAGPVTVTNAGLDGLFAAGQAGGTLSFAAVTVMGAAGNGVDLVENSGAVFTFNDLVTVSDIGSDGFELSGNLGGTVTLTGLDASFTGENGLYAAGNTGTSFTVGGPTTITEAEGDGIGLEENAGAEFTFIGAVDITQVSGDGLYVGGNSFGGFNFAGLTVAGVNGNGVLFGENDGITAGFTGLLDASDLGDDGLEIFKNTDSTFNFAGVTVDFIGGDGIFASENAGTAATIAGPVTITAFDLDGIGLEDNENATFSFTGAVDVSEGAGDGLYVGGNSGGSFSFAGVKVAAIDGNGVLLGENENISAGFTGLLDASDLGDDGLEIFKNTGGSFTFAGVTVAGVNGDGVFIDENGRVIASFNGPLTVSAVGLDGLGIERDSASSISVNGLADISDAGADGLRVLDSTDTILTLAQLDVVRAGDIGLSVTDNNGVSLEIGAAAPAALADGVALGVTDPGNNGVYLGRNTGLVFTVSGATEVSDTGLDGDGIGIEDNGGGAFTFAGPVTITNADLVGLYVGGQTGGTLNFGAVTVAGAGEDGLLLAENNAAAFTFAGLVDVSDIGGDGVEISGTMGGSFDFAAITSASTVEDGLHVAGNTNASLSVSGAVDVSDAAGDGLDFEENSGGSFTMSGTVTAADLAGDGLYLGNNMGGTYDFASLSASGVNGNGLLFVENTDITASFGGPLTVGDVDFDALSIKRDSGSSFTFTGAADLSGAQGDGVYVADSTGTSLTMGQLDIAGVGESGIHVETSDGTFTFGATTILDAGDAGILLDGVAGRASFGATTITNPAFRGVGALADGVLGVVFDLLDISIDNGALGNDGLTAEGLDSLTIGAGSTIDVVDGNTLRVSGLGTLLDVAFDRLTGSNSVDGGILLSGVIGDFAGGDVTLSGSAGNALALSGVSYATVSFGTVDISDTADNGILIDGATDSSFTFGATTVTNSGGAGTSFTGNSNGSINFGGGLTINTTGGNGVEASGNDELNLTFGTAGAAAADAGPVLSVSNTGDNGLYLAGDTDFAFTVNGATEISDTGLDGDGIEIVNDTDGDFTFDGPLTISHAGGYGLSMKDSSAALTVGATTITDAAAGGILLDGVGGTADFGVTSVTESGPVGVGLYADGVLNVGFDKLNIAIDNGLTGNDGLTAEGLATLTIGTGSSIDVVNGNTLGVFGMGAGTEVNLAFDRLTGSNSLDHGVAMNGVVGIVNVGDVMLSGSSGPAFQMMSNFGPSIFRFGDLLVTDAGGNGVDFSQNDQLGFYFDSISVAGAGGHGLRANGNLDSTIHVTGTTMLSNIGQTGIYGYSNTDSDFQFVGATTIDGTGDDGIAFLFENGRTVEFGEVTITDPADVGILIDNATDASFTFGATAVINAGGDATHFAGNSNSSISFDELDIATAGGIGIHADSNTDLDLTVGTGGAGAAAFGDGSSITGTTGDEFSITNANGGTYDLSDFDFDLTRSLEFDEMALGNTGYALSLGDLSIHDVAGAGLAISNADGNSYSFGAVTIANAGGEGVSLTGNSDTGIAIASLDIGTVGGVGLLATGNDGLGLGIGGAPGMAAADPVLKVANPGDNGVYLGDNTDLVFTVNGATEISDTGTDGDGIGIEDNEGGSFTFTGPITITNATVDGLYVGGQIGGTLGFGAVTIAGAGDNGVLFAENEDITASFTGLVDVSDLGDDGIELFGNSGGSFTFAGVTVDGAGGDGVYVDENTDVTADFTGPLTISNVDYDALGIELDTDGAFTFTDTATLSNTFFDGVFVSESTGTSLSMGQVDVTDAGDYGIHVELSDGTFTFGQTTITDPFEAGIYLDGVAGTASFGATTITGPGFGGAGLFADGVLDVGFDRLNIDIDNGSVDNDGMTAFDLNSLTIGAGSTIDVVDGNTLGIFGTGTVLDVMFDRLTGSNGPDGGIALVGVTGSFAGGDVTLTGSANTALEISDSLDATFTFGDVSVTDAENNGVEFADNEDSSATFGSITVDGAGDDGIDLDDNFESSFTVTGRTTVSNTDDNGIDADDNEGGTFTFVGFTTILDAGDEGIDLATQGGVTFSFGAVTITDPFDNGIQIEDSTDSSFTFGATTVTNAGGDATSFSGNSNTTIDFGGGLTVSGAGGAGVSASENDELTLRFGAPSLAAADASADLDIGGTGGEGISISDATDGTYDFGVTSVVNAGGDGVLLSGNEGGDYSFARLDVDTATNVGLHLQDNQGISASVTGATMITGTGDEGILFEGGDGSSLVFNALNVSVPGGRPFFINDVGTDVTVSAVEGSLDGHTGLYVRLMDGILSMSGVGLSTGPEINQSTGTFHIGDVTAPNVMGVTSSHDINVDFGRISLLGTGGPRILLSGLTGANIQFLDDVSVVVGSPYSGRGLEMRHLEDSYVSFGKLDISESVEYGIAATLNDNLQFTASGPITITNIGTGFRYSSNNSTSFSFGDLTITNPEFSYFGQTGNTDTTVTYTSLTKN